MKYLGKLAAITAIALTSAAPLMAQSAFEGGYYGGSVDITGGGTSEGGWTGDGSGDHSGVGIAGFVGYNFGSGPWVYGGELNVGYSNATGSEECANPTWVCQTEIGTQASVRGRVGYTVDPNVLVYGFGGYAVAQANLTTIDAGLVEYPGKATVQGYVLGLGLETAIQEMPGNLRVELAHNQFGATDFVNDTTYTGVELSNFVISVGMVFGF